MTVYDQASIYQQFVLDLELHSLSDIQQAPFTWTHAGDVLAAALGGNVNACQEVVLLCLGSYIARWLVLGASTSH